MYASLRDVRNALYPASGADGPPTGLTRTAADMSDSQLTDAIEEADGRIDAYLSNRYVTPVAPGDNGVYPTPVRWWSRDIACYLATLTYRKGKDLTATDPVALRMQQTMLDLVAARDGKSQLPLPRPNTADGGTGQAGPVIQQYVGNLFGTSDFDLALDSGELQRRGRWGWASW